MTRAGIRAAMEEARRFLARAEEALRETEGAALAEDDPIWSAPRASGAVRRASMDLTRALAAMRRPFGA